MFYNQIEVVETFSCITESSVGCVDSVSSSLITLGFLDTFFLLSLPLVLVWLYRLLFKKRSRF